MDKGGLLRARMQVIWGRRLEEEEKRKLRRLYEHAVALEIELARYASKFGPTAEALRLLTDSPLAEVPPG